MRIAFTRMRALLSWLSMLLLSSLASAAMGPAPIEAHALFTPQMVFGSDGLRHLAYELQITNFYATTGTLKLNRVDVFADASSTPLASFAGTALGDVLGPGKALEADNSLVLAAGTHSVLFVWLALPKDAAAPVGLSHRLVFTTESGETQVATDMPVGIDPKKPVVIGPPLKHDTKAVHWLVDEGPGLAQSHHWGSLVAENGRLTDPQRYAIDFFGLDATGHGVTVPWKDLATSTPPDWIGFDADVIAVADGLVREVRDGIPDNKPLAPQEQPTEMTPEGLYGNFVILEIAPNVFVHYAHLHQGSVHVKRGDRVRRGALLGRLGVSGGAGAPHLHFHVSSSAGFAGSQGLPFVFERFTWRGRGSESDTLDLSKGVHLERAIRLQRALPLNGDLIGF